MKWLASHSVSGNLWFSGHLYTEKSILLYVNVDIDYFRSLTGQIIKSSDATLAARSD